MSLATINNFSLTECFLSELPTLFSFIWIIFNIYSFGYFLVNYLKIRNFNEISNDIEFYESDIPVIANDVEETVMEDDNDDDIYYYNDPEPTVKYLKLSDVLVYNTNKSEEAAEIEKLNEEINSMIPGIVNILQASLPSFKDNDIITEKTYNKLKTNSWKARDIKLSFLCKAVDHCEDVSNDLEIAPPDNTKVVYEGDLLWYTKELMKKWLESTGEDVSFLVNISS